MGGYLSGITVFLLDNEVEISKVQSLNGWLKPVGIGEIFTAHKRRVYLILHIPSTGPMTGEC